MAKKKQETKCCIICLEDKPGILFSKEHIFPDALLRRTQNNVLLINDVCQNCNNNFGLHVDAPFIKYWFINMAKVAFDLKYADLQSDEVVAFSYLGHIEELAFEGKVCEHYRGPGGDYIYNFHDPYSPIENEEIVQGFNPIHKLRKENKGDVILIVRTNNPVWIRSLLASFNYHFKSHTKFVSPNTLVDPQQFPVPPKKYMDALIRTKDYKQSFSISGFTGERFLAKLAIEFGFHVLNAIFRNSEQISLLRRFVRERDFKERKSIPVYALGPLKVEKQLKFPNEKLIIENVHVMAFIVIECNLFFYLNVYGKVSGAILVSANYEHWKGLFTKGYVYFIAPALGQIFGPIRQCEDCKETCKMDTVREEIIGRMNELPINPPAFIP